MSKHVRWLQEQLKSWVAEGLISAQQAEQIRQRYPEPKGGAPWGTIIFAGLGAIVFGLGVILLFAYNWQAIPKAGKLAVIFLSILASHATGLWQFARQDWRRPLGEALTLLGTMLYGAGIWLVAQIYHIDEHFPNGFLLWAAGALVLAWAMPSMAQGILSVVLLCIWACSEAWGFDRTLHIAPWLILLGVGGLSWHLRSRLLLVFVLAGLNLTLLATVGSITGDLVLPVWLYLAAAFLAVGKLAGPRQWFAASEPVWRFFGWLGFLVSLYLLTFGELVDDVLGWAGSGEQNIAGTVLRYAWGAFAVALLAWLPLAAEWIRRGEGRRLALTEAPEEWLVPLTAILLHVVCISRLYREEWLVAGIFNLVFLALAAAWMGRGCRGGLVWPTVLGSLLFAALAIARYFDLFDSLLARGLVFLAVGGVLFGEGILFMRARRRARTQEPGT
jgi:uncharacterized membrane protein